MNRFDEQGLRRFRARDAIVAVCLAAILLILFEGTSIRRAGERLDPGVVRDSVLAVGKPTGWLAEQLPLAAAADDATAWLSPDPELTAGTGFAADESDSAAVRTAGVPPVTADAFDRTEIGAAAEPRRPLRTMLVTGDSMSTPLDTHVARLLADTDVRVIRDPHLGTGISKSFVVDWGELSSRQVRDDRPDAVVVFIGANEGYPMPGPDDREVECCGPDWAAIYANRVRRMANTYRRDGAGRVYWITLPTPRASNAQPITRVVNAAIAVAAQPWRAHVRVIDTVPVFSPSGYRDAMDVDGTEEIVRDPDGKHLSDAGSRLLAEIVMREIGRDYTY